MKNKKGVIQQYLENEQTVGLRPKRNKRSIQSIDQYHRKVGKKLKESGKFEKALNLPYKKIALEKLRAYVKENPDTY